MAPATLNPTPHDSRLLDRAISDGLIKAASLAPSPDNNQPWAFAPDTDSIRVYHRRSLGLPSDSNDMFSWMAIGAAVENIVLEASKYALHVDVRWQERPFDTVGGDELVATILMSSGGRSDPLAGEISNRVTNRRLYRRTTPSTSVLENITSQARVDSGRLTWLTGPQQLGALSRLISVTDRIRFEIQSFHEEFQHVLRTSDSAKDGLPLSTLELPPLGAQILAVLRPWNRMRLANRFGISRAFANYSAKQVRYSGAVGLLSSEADSDVAILESARAFQRIWLAVTAEGLAFQPLGALPLFLARLRRNQTECFTDSQISELRAVQRGLDTMWGGTSHAIPVMAFRVGCAQPPSARTNRYATEEVTISRDTRSDWNE